MEKFVDSLRLRIALRIADRESGWPNKKLRLLWQMPPVLLTVTPGIFSSFYTSSPSAEIRLLPGFETRDDFRVSKTVVDKLKALSDPRLAVYA